MSNIDWEQFQKPAAGDYPERWRPENEGDTVTGKIKQIRIATMPDGQQYPSIMVDTAEGEREILASQAMLLRLFANQQPKVGDTITIVHTSVEKLSGGRTLKHFDLTVEPAVTRTTPLV